MIAELPKQPESEKELLLSPVQEAEKIKEMARIRKLLEKNELELDEETSQIVGYVVQGKIVNGVEKMLTKSWVISTLLQFWYDCKRPSTKQRTFEFICELLNMVPKAGAKEGQIMDVIIGDSRPHND